MATTVRADEHELAEAIRAGARQAARSVFGAYFEGTPGPTRLDRRTRASTGCPADATGIRPKGIYKFFGLPRRPRPQMP